MLASAGVGKQGVRNHPSTSEWAAVVACTALTALAMASLRSSVLVFVIADHHIFSAQWQNMHPIYLL